MSFSIWQHGCITDIDVLHFIKSWRGSTVAYSEVLLSQYKTGKIQKTTDKSINLNDVRFFMFVKLVYYCFSLGTLSILTLKEEILTLGGPLHKTNPYH